MCVTLDDDITSITPWEFLGARHCNWSFWKVRGPASQQGCDRLCLYITTSMGCFISKPKGGPSRATAKKMKQEAAGKVTVVWTCPAGWW